MAGGGHTSSAQPARSSCTPPHQMTEKPRLKRPKRRRLDAVKHPSVWCVCLRARARARVSACARACVEREGGSSRKVPTATPLYPLRPSQKSVRPKPVPRAATRIARTCRRPVSRPSSGGSPRTSVRDSRSCQSTPRQPVRPARLSESVRDSIRAPSTSFGLSESTIRVYASRLEPARDE